jgi:hypothetical protein
VPHELLARTVFLLAWTALDNVTWASYGVMLGFGLSIPVLFATTYGWALWLVVPLLMTWLRRLQHRNRGPRGACRLGPPCG